MFMPLLDVDLTTRTWRALELPLEIRERWLGGTGLGVYLLSQSLKPGLRAIDPECPIFVLTGPLTGTSVPQSSDWAIVTLNPDYPKAICASHSHGYFGARMRHSGWDGVVVRGCADEPVYIWMDDDGVEIRSAEHLWGQDTFETQRHLVKEHERRGREVSVFCIGQAGESLVDGSSVRGDWAYGANQGGAGVAWGSKKLKAIAVAGTRPVPVFDQERLEVVSEEWMRAIMGTYPDFPEDKHYEGLKYMAGPLATGGWIGGKNFTDAEFGAAWGERLAKDYAKWKVEPLGGWNCKAMCHYKATCTTGPAAGVEFAGHGSGVMEDMGPNLGIEDPGVAFMLAGILDGYGLAGKSTPRTIAMLMEAFEAGDITLEQTNGLDLSWGNYMSVMELMELTAKREGIGELIAQGMLPTARALGIESRAFHMHGVGQPQHELRAAPNVLFQSQVVSGAGPAWQSLMELMLGRPEPDHGFEQPLQPTDVDRVAEATYATHKAKLLYDSLGVCLYTATGVRGVLRLLTDALEAAVGVRMTPRDYVLAGERIAVLQRMINVSRGYTPADDFDMSERFFEKIAAGPAAGLGMSREEWVQTRDDFYRLQGWSLETGAPLPETLERVGLDDFQLGGPSE